MSDDVVDGSERSLISKVKCRTLGHNWIYFRDQGLRQCRRCGHEEEYSVDETHEDENAEKGARRYSIEDSTLYVEKYQTTAWGDDTEYWQWFPMGTGPASEEHLRQLREEIERYLDTDTDRTSCPNCGEESEFVQFSTGEESTVATSPERIGDGLLELRTCNCGTAIENVLTVDEKRLIDVDGDS